MQYGDNSQGGDASPYIFDPVRHPYTTRVMTDDHDEQDGEGKGNGVTADGKEEEYSLSPEKESDEQWKHRLIAVEVQNCRYELRSYIERLSSEIDSEFQLDTSPSSSSFRKGESGTVTELEKENVELFHAIVSLNAHRTALLNQEEHEGRDGTQTTGTKVSHPSALGQEREERSPRDSHHNQPHGGLHKNYPRHGDRPEHCDSITNSLAITQQEKHPNSDESELLALICAIGDLHSSSDDSPHGKKGSDHHDAEEEEELDRIIEMYVCGSECSSQSVPEDDDDDECGNEFGNVGNRQEAHAGVDATESSGNSTLYGKSRDAYTSTTTDQLMWGHRPLISLPELLEDAFHLNSAILLGKVQAPPSSLSAASRPTMDQHDVVLGGRSAGSSSMLQWVVMGDPKFPEVIEMSSRLRQYVEAFILTTSPFCGGGSSEARCQGAVQEQERYEERCRQLTSPPAPDSEIRDYYNQRSAVLERGEVFGPSGAVLAEMIHTDTADGMDLFVSTIPVGFGERGFLYGTDGERSYGRVIPKRPKSSSMSWLNYAFKEYEFRGTGDDKQILEQASSMVVWDLAEAFFSGNPYRDAIQPVEPGTYFHFPAISYIPNLKVDGVAAEPFVTRCVPGSAASDAKKPSGGKKEWLKSILGIKVEEYPYRMLITKKRPHTLTNLIQAIRYRAMFIFGHQFFFRNDETALRMNNIAFCLFGQQQKHDPFSHYFHPQSYKQHRQRQLSASSVYHPPKKLAFGFGRPSAVYTQQDASHATSWMFGIHLTPSEKEFCRSRHLHPRIYCQLKRSLIEDPFRRCFCELEVGLAIACTQRGVTGDYAESGWLGPDDKGLGGGCGKDNDGERSPLITPDLATASELVSFFVSEGRCARLRSVVSAVLSSWGSLC